ncbi:hypothetical protein M404DRAFT_77593, partial [Pisolithus tinctorius Marx 270]
MGVEPFLSNAEAAMGHAVDFAKVLEDTKWALEKTTDQMRVNSESHWSEAPVYSVGDMWIGSYKVVSLKPNVVELKLPKTLRIHPVVNVSQVKPYKGP